MYRPMNVCLYFMSK